MQERKESQRRTALAIVSVRLLLLAVEQRSAAISDCCPSLLIDEENEKAARLRKVAEAQREVDASVVLFREAAEDRLAQYSDAEAVLLAHLWASVWSSASSLRLDSSDIDKLAGRNKPEAMDALIRALLDGSSMLFNFISIAWSPNRSGNCYAITLSNPNRLHRLVLGDIHIA